MTIQTRTTDEERFYKADDGEEVPSVTTILSVIDKSGPLVPWAVRTTCDFIGKELDKIHSEYVSGLDMDDVNAVLERAIKEATRVKEEAGDIGTAVHAVIQDWAESTIKGEAFFAHFTDPRMQTAWEAFERFADEVHLEPLKSELKMVHQTQRYGGQVDLIARVTDGEGKKKRILIDIKSSNHFLEIPYGPQVAAYAAMLPPKQLEEIGVLRLDKKTGVPDFHLLTEKRDGYMEIFKSAHALWKSLRGFDRRKKVKK